MKFCKGMVTICNRLKVVSLFSGIGAFEKALTNQLIPYELIGFSEIDKYAIKSYCAIHGVDESLNLGSVTDIDGTNLGKIDLLTHGSPCQSFSIASTQDGGDEGSGTKSSLMWETVRIIEESNPKIIVWENVKNVLSKKHIKNFNMYISRLDALGYNSYFEVLNANRFETPQNRERVFVVSIRKDIGTNDFKFNLGEETKLKIKDILEDNIAEKYVLSPMIQDRIQFLDKKHHSIIGTTAPSFRTIGERDWIFKIDGTMVTLLATDYKQPRQILIDVNGKQVVRKLSPLEYWRLMRFDDEDFYRAKSVGISDTQLYKQAGNSIVVTVLESIFKNLYK